MTTPERSLAARVVGLTLQVGDTLILDNIDLEIPEGDFLAIIGPNGAGKSVLIKLILGLITPTSGTIELYGAPPALGRKHVGYVPQFATFDRNFPITALEVVSMGVTGQGGLFARIKKKDREMANEALQQVELQHLAARQIGALSGGELQRVLIARAIVQNPRMIILDEPTASLDTKIGKSVFELIKQLGATKTIVMITHDIGVVSSYVKTIACLNRRIFKHDAECLTENTLQDLYGGHVDIIKHEIQAGHTHRLLAHHHQENGHQESGHQESGDD